jgi:hypothetical protein
MTNPAKFWPMPWDEVDSGENEIKRLAHLNEEETQEEVRKFLQRVNKGNGTIR